MILLTQPHTWEVSEVGFSNGKQLNLSQNDRDLTIFQDVTCVKDKAR